MWNEKDADPLGDLRRAKEQAEREYRETTPEQRIDQMIEYYEAQLSILRKIKKGYQ